MPEIRHAQAQLIASTLRESDDPPEWAVEYVEKCLSDSEKRGAKKALVSAADDLLAERGKFAMKLRSVLLGFDHIFIAAWLKRRAIELE